MFHPHTVNRFREGLHIAGHTISRRRFLGTIGLGTLGAALAACGSRGPSNGALAAVQPAAFIDSELGTVARQDNVYQLPPLPYPASALEPNIDERTMTIHHDRHHQGYVNNLNEALQDYPDLRPMPLDELLADPAQIPEEIRTKVINNGGGHLNHSIFWTVMSPQGGGEPTGELATAMNDAFGSFAEMRDRFTSAALGRFGSGWAWLVLDSDGDLGIMSTSNQDTPYMVGLVPLLGIDVWEHAYYLKYQNLRGDYVQAWWNTVNWPEVARRLEAARG